MSSPLASPASRRGFLLVVLAALCWGTSGVSGKIVADRTGLGPLDIAWHRMAIGAVVLLLGYALSTRRRRSAAPVALTRGTVVRLVLVGAGLAAYQLAYFAAVADGGGEHRDPRRPRARAAADRGRRRAARATAGRTGPRSSPSSSR